MRTIAWAAVLAFSGFVAAIQPATAVAQPDTGETSYEEDGDQENRPAIPLDQDPDC